MRLRRLQLIKYGRFEDCRLEFPPATCDLHMIVGPNEAGKSTTLAAVGDLLFGFPHRTAFDFQFDRQLLRIGAVIETEAGSLEVRRRKGTADTLLGPDDRPLGDAAIAPMLGGQTRATFERMFGLDQARLRAGGQAMLDASDNAGHAIFAAGSGLLGVSRLCDALEDEAKEIWTNRAGGARRYHQAAAAYHDARVRMREAEVRTYKWTEARRAFAASEEQLELLRRERAEVALHLRSVERKRRVLASVSRRALLEIEIERQPAGLDLAFADETRLEEAVEARDRAAADIAAAERDIGLLASELEQAEPRTDVLALMDEIEALREAKAAVEEARSVRPGLAAQLAAKRLRLTALAVEIGWPADEPGAMKGRLPGRPALAELEDLIARRGGIEEQLRAARETLTEAKDAVARLGAQVAAFPAPEDMGPLQELLRDLVPRALPEATARAAAELAQLEGVLAARLRSLSPWTGDAAALRALQLPADEDVDHLAEQLDTVASTLEEAASDCTREAELLQQLELERRQRTLEHPAPSVEDLASARFARQAAWTPLRTHLAGGQPVPSADAAISIFEKSLDVTDELADARFVGAEHAGGLAALEREIEKTELRLAQATSRRDEAQERLAKAAAEFDALVRAIAPGLTHRSIHGWRDAVAEALEVANGRDAAAGNHQAALKAEADASAALHALLGQVGGLSTLTKLLAYGQRQMDLMRTAQSQFEAARIQLESARAAEAKASTRALAAKQSDDAWREAWAPAILQASLPSETGLAAARARLKLIEEVRSEVDDMLDLEIQLSDVEARVGGHEARTQAAVTRLGLQAGPHDQMSSLHAEAERAARLADRSTDLKARLEVARGRLTDSQGLLATAETVLKPLLSAAPQGEASALRELLRQARELRRLREERRKAEADIVESGDGHSLEGLIEEVDGTNPDDLATEAQALSERMDDLNMRVETQSAARQRMEAAFQAIDDGPQAAAAASDMAQARSEMVEQADLYMRKRAEIRLLRAGIERYRKEKQAPLLARASDLFNILTLGAFSGLLVEYDGDVPKLLGVRADGAAVTPVDGMSEGTVDQLFLALRVAAIEDAVDQGARLPFLADDLFVNYDDERAAAGFKVLGDLAAKTQVLFFTHHPHLKAVATGALSPLKVSFCNFESKMALEDADTRVD